MADPFNPYEGFAGTQPPGGEGGFAGLGADQWRSLMAFGASMLTAANARTPQGFLAYGPGFGGALGAGALGAMDQARQTAQMRSQLGYQGAETQHLQTENELTRMQLPFMAAKLRAAQDFFGGGQGSAGSPSGPVPFQGGTGEAPAQGNEAPASSSFIPPEQRPGLLTQAVAGTPVPPTLLDALVTHESGWNANAKGLAGDIGLGQVMPSTAQNPGFGMAGVNPVSLAGGAGAPGNLQFAAHYLYARGRAAGMQDADWQDPNKWPIALGGYHAGPDNPAYTRTVMGLAQKGPSWAGAAQQAQAQGQQGTTQPQGQPGRFVPQGMPTPQEALAQANAMSARAQQGRAAGIETGPLQAQADALRSYALGSLKNIDVRNKGWAWSPSLGILRGPDIEKLQSPTGEEYLASVTPPISMAGLPSEPGSVVPMRMGQGAGGPSAGGGAGGTPGTGAASGPAITNISPQQEEFLKTRGTGLAHQMTAIDEDAAAAVNSNYLFDNLRRDSQTWDMGKFADFEGHARAYVSAFAHSVGIEPTGMDQKLGDYQAFVKSSGMLLREAVHKVSSRAAVQEYRMIGDTLPQPTTSAQGFAQIADQWQALNDFDIAKQSFARRFQGNPQDFNVEFNKQVSPAAFLMHRMMQSPEGQQDFAAMLSRMQQTGSGRALAAGLADKLERAQSLGLFDDIDYSGESPRPEGTPATPQVPMAQPASVQQPAAAPAAPELPQTTPSDTTPPQPPMLLRFPPVMRGY